jgi:hypothetical protein
MSLVIRSAMVDFPPPEAPTRANIRFFGISILTPERTGIFPLYEKETLRNARLRVNP